MLPYPQRVRQAVRSRHAAVQDIMRYFDFDHLPVGPLRDRSADCAELALAMVLELPDCPMLTRGLDNLLSAKDCFVRAALPPTTVEQS